MLKKGQSIYCEINKNDTIKTIKINNNNNNYIPIICEIERVNNKEKNRYYNQIIKYITSIIILVVFTFYFLNSSIFI